MYPNEDLAGADTCSSYTLATRQKKEDEEAGDQPRMGSSAGTTCYVRATNHTDGANTSRSTKTNG